jgi:hypothetical protein
MPNTSKVFILRVVHSVIFWIMVACLLYILYCAVARRYDWTLVVALGFIFVEGVALAVNRFRCPLTALAERWGAGHGAITDMFLPGWLASNTFKVSTVVFILEVIGLAVGYFNR